MAGFLADLGDEFDGGAGGIPAVRGEDLLGAEGVGVDAAGEVQEAVLSRLGLDLLKQWMEGVLFVGGGHQLGDFADGEAGVLGVPVLGLQGSDADDS